MLPFLRSIIEFWLKDNAIAVNYYYALCFAVYSCVSIWIAIQSSIVAGLGKLKVQAWLYTFAVIFKIAVIILVAKLGGSWKDNRSQRIDCCTSPVLYRTAILYQKNIKRNETCLTCFTV